MPLARVIDRATRRAQAWPWWARYGGALGFVGVAFLARLSLTGFLPGGGIAFLPFFPAILASAVIFANGAGFFSTVASAVAATYFTPPVGEFWISHPVDLASLAAFILAGLATAATVETLHGALRRLRVATAEREAALAAREAAEQGRRLLLDEFRHRSRNDLQSLVGLLLLRARQASPEGKVALREAAAHALGLARVHTRLAQASAVGTAAVIDTAAFLHGLCSDLAAGAAGDGLRPVALVVEAEAHALSTERAVQVGLIVNETVTNALKYGFPGDMAGAVRVRFARCNGDFVLTVADDGIGMRRPGEVCEAACPTSGACENAKPDRGPGLGTRLLRALAAQLRGSFVREAGPRGGTRCELRFPFREPGAG